MALKYTANDHKTFLVLWQRSGMGPVPFELSMSNSELASKLGIGVSGAASRMKRLEELGVVDLLYESDPAYGRIIVRRIIVKEKPMAPWGFDEYS